MVSHVRCESRRPGHPWRGAITIRTKRTPRSTQVFATITAVYIIIGPLRNALRKGHAGLDGVARGGQYPRVNAKALPSRVVTPMLAAILLFAAGCVAARQSPARPTPGLVQHVVLCWLREPRNAADREALIDASQALTDIPGLLSLRTGTALPSERPIVDSSFDLALIMTFTDEAAMRTYLNHPLHVTLVETQVRPRVARLLVYDILETPADAERERP